MSQKNKKQIKIIAVAFLVTAFLLSGFPSSDLLKYFSEKIADKNIVDSLYLAKKDPNVIDKGFVNLMKPKVETADAATFKMQTGYYIGNGAAKSVTGLGFRPEMILLKPNTTAGAGAVFKTTAMAQLNVPYFVATADTTAGAIKLDEDGFTVNSASTDTANTGHTWVAMAGSDCSASGNFCVGSYIGNGTSPRAIDTGFRPDLVWVKQSTAVAGNWRSSNMPDNYAQYFQATNQETTGALFTTLNATGFTVGATNNTNAAIYYYVAFKNTAGVINTGTYTGNATDNRNITGVGMTPDFTFLKNANAGTAVSAVYNTTDSYGDNSSYYTDTANLVDSIQALQSDGFQVGANATSNGSGNTIYYAAFAGSSDTRTSSGTFKMGSGSYTGTGRYQNISSLDFMPDLVIIKGDTAQAGVFRLSLTAGDVTSYLDSATADFAGGIISINPNGFTVGTSATVNTASTTYYWTAYGNAWNMEKNSGASDFFIGAYYGNGIDNRNINRLPYQPNMVTVKRSGASGGVFRTSAHSGDLSSFFAATAEAANNVQIIQSDGFQVGNAANVNTSANLNWYFGFKTGANFAVGSYNGSGSSQNITAPGFQPDYVWVKHPSTTRGVQRNSSVSGDGAIPFINVAKITNAITGFIATGFTVNTAAETNSAGVNNYRYVVWKIPNTGGSLSVDIVDSGGAPVASPSVAFSGKNYLWSGQQSTSTLGASNQKIRVTNGTSTPSWTLAIAASGGNTSLWTSGGNNYDYNGNASAGRLQLDPSVATITPQSGCSETGLSKGSSAYFAQGSQDSINLVVAGGSAGTSCYWDITGVGMNQDIPASQITGTYSISMTLTVN